jgi:hypothetical protein
MNIIQRHKAAWLEQIAGAQLLAQALKKRAKYIGQVFSFWWHGPRVILTQQQGIQNVDEAVGILQQRIAELQARLRFHEHGPLSASARTLQRRAARLKNLKTRAAAAKTAEEHEALAREAAQLQSEMEADAMPDADVTIDAQNGQVVDRKITDISRGRIITP